MVGCAGYRSAVGFFLYLRAMRRWFTLAGLVLVLVGLFGHFRPILLIGFALIALQLGMSTPIGPTVIIRTGPTSPRAWSQFF
jgi:hypothetical protein